MKFNSEVKYFLVIGAIVIVAIVAIVALVVLVALLNGLAVGIIGAVVAFFAGIGYMFWQAFQGETWAILGSVASAVCCCVLPLVALVLGCIWFYFQVKDE